MFIPGLNLQLTAPYGLAILRVVLGIAMLVHGWQKWSGGIENVAGFFGTAGIPAPTLMAYLVATIETLGGLFLIVGFLTQISAILIALVVLGAILFVQSGGELIEGGGLVWEKEAVFAAAALCLFLAGPGAWSVDDVVIDTRRRA